MKLRDFVANSLPRVRGRKKKVQTTTTTTTNAPPASITAAVAAAAVSATNARSFSASQQNSPDGLSQGSAQCRPDGNGNWFSFSESRLGFLEKLVGKDSPVKRLLETRERRLAAKSEKRSEDKGRRTSTPGGCHSSATEPSSPYGSGRRVQSPPLGEKPVFHSQHASPVSTGWLSSRDRCSDWDCCSLYPAGYGYPDSLTSFPSTPGSLRGPRSRSRIRTNPWLPSPRPSPYSTRSLSSPCTSSRSPSPSLSSSPAPPSSSDSTSPLTSFGSDVSAKRESQLQRHRRHRRHHSEVKASELTRAIAFDPPLTDTEQYYSTLDSGIGDTATSSGEKDRHKVATSRKQRSHHSKRRSVDRDLEQIKTVASSSPKAKPKFRSKTRSSHQSSSSSKALIANRDSKFWDSDSSSRSPPRVCRSLAASKDSLHFDNFHPESCVLSCTSPRLPGTPVVAPGFMPGDFLCQADPVDFCPVSGPCQSSVLSLCDDICIITSNIEQLAQNISSEYEESLDVSSESMLDNASRQEKRQESLRELYNPDENTGPVTHTLDTALSSALDYSSFAGPLQCTLLRAEEEETCDSLQNDTSTDSPHTDLSSHEDTSTVDVAVQTDFADDDEEDVSLSDWQASTESGSDWVTSNGSGSDWVTGNGSGSDWVTGNGSGSDWVTSNGSGSDWVTSNGSGSDWVTSNGSGSDWPTSGDWQTGEGSGCATEEEEEEGGRKEAEEGEEEVTVWVEGSRLWIVPDVMQNSTDTGYSSLSRDGRIVTDDNNNNNNNNNNNIVSHADDTSDSSSANTATDDKMSKMSDSDVTKSEIPSATSSSDVTTSGAIPKTSARQSLSTYTPTSEAFDKCGEAGAQRISCRVEFNIMGGNCRCSRNVASCRNEKTLLNNNRPRAISDHCADDVEFSVPSKNREELRSRVQQTSREKGGRRNSSYDHVVPYPYDVRRFSDVVLPCDEREGSVSPCFYDSVPSPADQADTSAQVSAGLHTSTPLHRGRQGEKDHDFYPDLFTTDMTSDHHDVTDRDEAPASPEGRLESCQTRGVVVPPFRSSLPLRSLEALPCTGRPLAEVRASLESEVELLRQGRRLVSRKIREAREEEMVRQQQKLRFQRLLDIHRKRILLQTLQDLRHRLESQSSRLQASYSAVLSLQKRGV